LSKGNHHGETVDQFGFAYMVYHRPVNLVTKWFRCECERLRHPWEPALLANVAFSLAGKLLPASIGVNSRTRV